MNSFSEKYVSPKFTPEQIDDALSRFQEIEPMVETLSKEHFLKIAKLWTLLHKGILKVTEDNLQDEYVEVSIDDGEKDKMKKLLNDVQYRVKKSASWVITIRFTKDGVTKSELEFSDSDLSKFDHYKEMVDGYWYAAPDHHEWRPVKVIWKVRKKY